MTKPTNKSDFIRKHPTTPASELQKIAAKQGMKFSTNLVYAVRTAAEKKAGKRPKTKKSVVRVEAGSDTLESLLAEYTEKVRAVVEKQVVQKILGNAALH